MGKTLNNGFANILVKCSHLKYVAYFSKTDSMKILAAREKTFPLLIVSEEIQTVVSLVAMRVFCHLLSFFK